MKLSDVKQAQPGWFSRKNKRFSGDISYRVLHGKQSGDAYLVRSTFAWSDMFGKEKRLSWRVNAIDQETCEIRPLIDREFSSIDSVKFWLRLN